MTTGSQDARRKSVTRHKHPDEQRSSADIIRDINGVYNALSPENLYCDGELPAHQAARNRKRLERRLRDLFVEYGRPVDEAEAWRLSQR